MVEDLNRLFNSADAIFADGTVRAGNRIVALADAAGEAGLSAEDAIDRITTAISSGRYPVSSRRVTSRPTSSSSSSTRGWMRRATSSVNACSG